VEDWAGLFGAYLKSGVYRVTQGADAGIQDAALACGLEFAEVNLKGVAGKKGFLKKTARALSFPAYFGMNWDAFSDCLTDMGWRPAAGYVILFNGYYIFEEKAPADAKTAGRIFNSAALYWKDKKTPFFIGLVEKEPRST